MEPRAGMRWGARSTATRGAARGGEDCYSIAEELGCSPSTVRGWLTGHRALPPRAEDALVELLGEYQGGLTISSAWSHRKELVALGRVKLNKRELEIVAEYEAQRAAESSKGTPDCP